MALVKLLGDNLKTKDGVVSTAEALVVLVAFDGSGGGASGASARLSTLAL